MLFACCHLLLLVWTLRWSGSFSWRIWFLRAMLFGMFYDNFIQSTGFLFYQESWFESASLMRYALHVTVLPFLTLFALSLMSEVKIQIAKRNDFIIFCFLFTAGALSFGWYYDFWVLELAPETNFGISKLVSLSKMPPIATILTNILILPMAAAIWKTSGWKWFFLGAVFIFLVNGATGAQPWGFITGNFAELVFILSLLITERRFSGRRFGGKG